MSVLTKITRHVGQVIWWQVKVTAMAACSVHHMSYPALRASDWAIRQIRSGTHLGFALQVLGINLVPWQPRISPLRSHLSGQSYSLRGGPLPDDYHSRSMRWHYISYVCEVNPRLLYTPRGGHVYLAPWGGSRISHFLRGRIQEVHSSYFSYTFEGTQVAHYILTLKDLTPFFKAFISHLASRFWSLIKVPLPSKSYFPLRDVFALSSWFPTQGGPVFEILIPSSRPFALDVLIPFHEMLPPLRSWFPPQCAINFEVLLFWSPDPSWRRTLDQVILILPFRCLMAVSLSSQLPLQLFTLWI